jgi:SAM-dependent methyltransferase
MHDWIRPVSSAYDKSFYQQGSQIAISSAAEIVPIVIQLAAPHSVVDVGCGTGEWLSVFRAAGIPDILGVDGHWVPREALHIPESNFRRHDLSNEPLHLERRFDLAVSLEVGEHLPADQAVRLVADLVALSPVVLFSAALPYQGGVRHINEQWPDYWVRLFHSHRYICLDCIRSRVWLNDRVAFWYAQNCFVAVKETALKSYPSLWAEYAKRGNGVPALVHPLNYLVKVKEIIASKSVCQKR